MQMPRRSNMYYPNCRGHHEHGVEKIQAGCLTEMKWNAHQIRHGKAIIGNTSKFSRVSGDNKPTKKTHLKYICSNCGKAHVREDWRANRLGFQKQIVVGNFYKVVCSNCEDEQVIFGRASPIVSYAVCGTTLATPTNGNAEFHDEVVEMVECRDSDGLEAQPLGGPRIKYSGWPDPGELVVGRVDDITGFGVSVDFEEYEDRRGLCHISKVASGWTKDARDRIRKGQTAVAKAFEVSESSQQTDLSTKDINKHQRKEKIQEWKNEQKADRRMALVLGEDIADDRYQSIANAPLTEFGLLYDGFERAATHGIGVPDGVELDDDRLEAIVKTVYQSVSIPYVNVIGYVNLRSSTGDGVDDMKKALKVAEGDGEIDDEIELSVTYASASKCRIRVKAPDYETVETEFESSIARACEAIEAAGGTTEYHRECGGDEE